MVGRSLFVSASLAMLAVASHALAADANAQSAQKPADQSDGVLQDIIVTATR